MVSLEELQPVANRVIDQYFRSGLASLDPRDRVFFLIWCHAGELDNGGHAAFFYNSEADNYAETIDALNALGLNSAAVLLNRAAAVLFDGVVPRTLDERNAIIDELPDDPSIDDELEALNQEFFGNGGGSQEIEVLARWYFDNLRLPHAL